MVRRWLLIGTGAALLLGVCGAAVLFYLVNTSEAWERRVDAVPYMVRGYVRQWQPTAAVPTLAPEAGGDRALLLQEEAPAVTPTAVAAGAEREIPPTLTAPATEPPATPSVTPSPSVTPTPTETPYPLTPVPEAVALEGVQHTAQMWNNCGPATVAMNLSYYGLYLHQRETAAFLKPNGDDKNVSPEQLAAYAESQGFEAMIRVAGTIELLQKLVSNGIPVIVEDWILPEDRGGMGHYRLLTGFDAAEGYFIAQDSYFGPDKKVPFEELNRSWRVFNRKYIIIYEPQEAETVRAILGPMADDGTMYEKALAEARADAEANAEDALAWYTLGSSYTLVGDMERAAAAFDEARRIGLPLRTLWYQFELFEAYLAVGRAQEVIDLGYATSYTAGGHEEGYYYQALGYAAQGNEERAVAYLEQALRYNANFWPAEEALAEIRG